mgnify:CR=1 FL=1
MPDGKRERNEERCAHERRVRLVPVVAEVVVIRAPLPVVPVQVPDDEVAIGVAVRRVWLPRHLPLITHGSVSYSAS